MSERHSEHEAHEQRNEGGNYQLSMADLIVGVVVVGLLVLWIGNDPALCESLRSLFYWRY